MAKPTNLDVLRDLTRQQLDNASVQLRLVTDKLRQAHQQLEQLHIYRHDYQQRAQQSLNSGISASNYRNFVHFLGTLDNAISLQNKAIHQLDDAVAHARNDWQNKKRRLDAYDTLQSRRTQAMQQQENRREQRLSDERAMRSSTIHTLSTAAT